MAVNRTNKPRSHFKPVTDSSSRRGVEPQQDRTTSALALIGCAVLALILTVIAMGQLFRPGGMYAGMSRVDFDRIKPPVRGAALMRENDSNRFRAQLQSSLNHPDAVSYYRLDRMFQLLVSHEAAANPEALTRQAEALLAQDRANPLMALGAAVLMDRGTASGTDPVKRFETMKSIVDIATGKVNTYHREYAQLWEKALTPFVVRPDVRRSLAMHMPEAFGESSGDQYRGLLEISRDLSGLENALRETKRNTEADQVVLWKKRLGDAFFSEIDPAMQLLAAQIYLDTVKDDAGSAKPIMLLLDDFHSHVAAAPTNLLGQEMLTSPSRAAFPAAYQWALCSFFVAVILFAFATIYFLLTVVLGFAGLMSRLMPKRRIEESAKAPRLILRAGLVIIPAAISALVVISQLVSSGLYSQAWMTTTMVAAIALAIGGITILAGLWSEPRHHISRLSIVGGLILVSLIWLCLPPVVMAKWSRAVDLSTTSLVWMIVVLVIFGVTCCFLTPARVGTIARTALLAWLVNAGAAVVAMEVNRQLDHRYQALAVEGYFDEISARLGKDWRERYAISISKGLAQSQDTTGTNHSR